MWWSGSLVTEKFLFFVKKFYYRETETGNLYKLEELTRREVSNFEKSLSPGNRYQRQVLPQREIFIREKNLSVGTPEVFINGTLITKKFQRETLRIIKKSMYCCGLLTATTLN